MIIYTWATWQSKHWHLNLCILPIPETSLSPTLIPTHLTNSYTFSKAQSTQDFLSIDFPKVISLLAWSIASLAYKRWWLCPLFIYLVSLKSNFSRCLLLLCSFETPSKIHISPWKWEQTPTGGADYTVCRQMEPGKAFRDEMYPEREPSVMLCLGHHVRQEPPGTSACDLWKMSHWLRCFCIVLCSALNYFGWRWKFFLE